MGSHALIVIPTAVNTAATTATGITARRSHRARARRRVNRQSSAHPASTELATLHLDQPPITHVQDPIRELVRQGIMAGHHRQQPVLREVTNARKQGGRVLTVQCPGGLISQQHRPATSQGPRYPHPLLPPPGQLRCPIPSGYEVQ